MFTIAIVGRPNVGKSALFNCLAGRRIAIVDSAYGLTRDRVSATVSGEGERYDLIDTGGIDFEAAGTIREMAKRQTELAIEQANLILMVTDAQEGLVPLDREISGMLRRSGKDVILVVNKADNEKLELATPNFRALGFPMVLPVSAMHNRGFDNLREAMSPGIPGGEDAGKPPALKIAIVGKPNVGKSSLVNRVLREERMIVDETPGTTRDAVDIHTTWRGRGLVLIDTAGVRREGKIKEPVDYFSLARARAGVRRCDVALMIIDAKEGVTTQDEKLAGSIGEQGRGCVLAINKWDLAKGVQEKNYRDYIWKKMRFFDYVPMVFMSAKTGGGVERALETVLYVNEQLNKQIPTPLLNRVLHGIWEKNEPSSRKGKRGVFYYATQVRSNPPTLNLFVNNASLITDAYRNYLVNGLRRSFGLEGVPVTIRLMNRRRK